MSATLEGECVCVCVCACSETKDCLALSFTLYLGLENSVNVIALDRVYSKCVRTLHMHETAPLTNYYLKNEVIPYQSNVI